MRKDYFYYCLKQRLDLSQEYAIKCATQLKYIEVYNKADGEFFINNKILFMMDEILNFPSNLLKYYRILLMKLNLKKCLADIKVIKKEIDKYEMD